MNVSRHARTIGVIAGLALFVAIGMVVVVAADRDHGSSARAAAPLPENAIATAEQLSHAYAVVAARVRPTVVSVYSEKIVKVRSQGWPFGSDNDLFRQFFGNGAVPFNQPQERSIPEHGMGSGILLDPEGHILTNNHVVNGVDQIKVRLADRRIFSAKVVGTDPKADIAVIQIEGNIPPDLPTASFGNSDSLQVGNLVLAIGAPFGLTQTVTQGIVSATGRSNVGIEDYEDFVQTDAPINPGNSGGPLVDMHGDVIGMNTAIATHIGQSAGVGFAIPANLIESELPTLIRGGTIARGLLGVIIQDVNTDLAKQFHLPDDNGALVAQVEHDSPAASAGIEVGDAIVRYNGKAITDTHDLRNDVAATSPGTRVPVEIIRNGHEKKLEVTVGAQPNQQVAKAGGAATGGDALHKFGLEVEPLTPDLAQRFGVKDKHGVVISGIVPGTVASMSGLQVGDVIHQADRKPVESVDQLEHVLASASDKSSVLLWIERKGQDLFVVLSEPVS